MLVNGPTMACVLALLAAAKSAADPAAPRLFGPVATEPTSGDNEASSASVGAVSLGIGAAVLTAGAIAWWADKGFEDFHLKETGLFGRGTYAGGADKVGHLFSNYSSLRVMSAVYRGLGVPHGRAVAYAAAFTVIVAEGVEVIDGFTRHGFEYGDVVMNLAGTGLALMTELHPVAGRAFGMRIGYFPSRDFIQGPKSYVKLVNDYSGQVIYADLKPGGLLEALGVAPGPARFFLAGVNYGSYMYSPVEGSEAEKRRNLGVHVGLALPEILRALGLGPVGRGAAGFFEYYAPPLVMMNVVRELNHDRFYLSFGIANRFEAGG